MRGGSLENLSVAILMGGKSQRMGKDKGLLDFNGKKMVQHVIDVGATLSDNIFLIGNQQGYEAFELMVYQDIPIGEGPLKGILTALYHSKNERVLILACDMPNFSESAVHYLLEHDSTGKTLIPKVNNEIHPFGGIYQKSAYPVFLDRLEKHEYKIMDAVAMVPWHAVDLDNSGIHEDCFANINTKEDLTQMS